MGQFGSGYHGLVLVGTCVDRGTTPRTKNGKERGTIRRLLGRETQISCTGGGKTVSPPLAEHRAFGARGVIRETTRGVTGTTSGRVAL